MPFAPLSCPSVKFTIVGDVRNLEVIARGHGIRELARLRRLYGGTNWRKMKGTAVIEYAGGRLCLAELHWYEAHGIGKVEIRDKKILHLL